jgi:DNA-binding transcriptional MerR regulator
MASIKKSRSTRGRGTALRERAYTSREAAEVTEVPFFTIDYWGRTRFLVPTVAKGRGRGKGRQRMYSYGDLIRIRIARELREQSLSLESLRSIIHKLVPIGDDLAEARFVLIGRAAEASSSRNGLIEALRRSSLHTFGVLLDLRVLNRLVRDNARQLEARSKRLAEMRA